MIVLKTTKQGLIVSKYKLASSSTYRRQRKKLSPKDKEAIDIVIEKLANDEILEEKYKDHALIGNFKDYRECHIRPNLLLMYRIYDDILELYLAQVGTHSELFKK